MDKYFKNIGETESISSCKSKGLSDEIIKPPNNSFASTVKYTGKRMYVKFIGGCLKQEKIAFTHEKQWTYTLFLI